MAQDDETGGSPTEQVSARLRARAAAVQSARKLGGYAALRKGVALAVSVVPASPDAPSPGQEALQEPPRDAVAALATRVAEMVRLAAAAAPAALVYDALGQAEHVSLAERVLHLVRRELATTQEPAVLEVLATGQRRLDEAASAAGGLLAPAQVTKLFGISRATLHNRRTRGELLALPDDVSRAYRYPARQFDPAIRRAMPRVLHAGLEALGADGMLVYLTQVQPTLAHRAPFDAIRDGDADDVVAQLAAFSVPADFGAPLADDAA